MFLRYGLCLARGPPRGYPGASPRDPPEDLGGVPPGDLGLWVTHVVVVVVFDFI